jgi:hypothetical protein
MPIVHFVARLWLIALLGLAAFLAMSDPVTAQAPSSIPHLTAAVLPESRSVEVGNTATVFATIIDDGAANASGCGIAPLTSIPATFFYQTTNPSTNALTGTPNTAANIAQGASQSYVIALTPTAAFAPTNVYFAFTCANVFGPAQWYVGINTLNLSASTTPVPDIVALVASGDPGIVDISASSQYGAFAVATVNVGSADTITASADTGGTSLPISLNLCQTNPATGACVAPAAAGVTTTIAANATPTFAIFAGSSSAIPFDPANNRVFVRFIDRSGVLRGATSVAVRTQ